jgi:hypothetical protein
LGGLNFAFHTKTKLIINTSWYQSKQNGKNGLTLREPELAYFKKIQESFEFKAGPFPNFFNYGLGFLNRTQKSNFSINNVRFEYIFFKKFFLTNSFESSRFFPEISTINKWLVLPNEFNPELIKLSNSLISANPLVIHFRSGDHRNFPMIYSPANLKYYTDSAKMIFDNFGERPIWVLTDDIDHGVEFFKNLKVDLFLNFPQATNSVQILNFCSQVKYFIGSRSNFSWWIYFFANKQGFLVKAVLPKGEYFDNIIQDFHSSNLTFV